MRITANQHFTEFKVQVFPEHKPGPFATIEMHTTAIDYATIYLDSEAEADQLIRAACAAKDMLHAAKHATAMAAPPDQWLEEQPPAGDAPAPLAGLRDRDHYAAPDDIYHPAGDVSNIAEIPTIADAMAAKALAEADAEALS